jgi:hypothetical protein
VPGLDERLDLALGAEMAARALAIDIHALYPEPLSATGGIDLPLQLCGPLPTKSRFAVSGRISHRCRKLLVHAS